MTTALYLHARLREIEQAHHHQPLMQRAGAEAAKWAASLALPGRPVLVLAGPGNNGGDALEVARLLLESGFAVDTVFPGNPQALPEDAAAAMARFNAAGGQWGPAIPADRPWGLIVDGLFGIGLNRAPGEPWRLLINAANDLAEALACPVLALDCPSGLDADTGMVPGVCVHASHTLSFIAGKPGLYTGDGPDVCGEIRLATLGLTELPQAEGQLIEMGNFAAWLKPRRKNVHKGSFGSAAVLGGGKSMMGAAVLAARATLKLGTGRVYLGLLDPEAPGVDLLQPELMLRRVDTLFQADLQALACGPGMGHSGEAIRLLEQALKCPLPVVLDADALNILASDGRLEGNLYNRVAPAVLTPHPTEAARLLECSTREVQNDRVAAARNLARRYGCPVALKGCGTVIATVDGQWWINSSGNSGLATAGSGDVLTGLILALLAQGWPAEAALLGAVHLHGLAADRLVAEGIGPIGLTAGELIDSARRIFNEWVHSAP